MLDSFVDAGLGRLSPTAWDLVLRADGSAPETHAIVDSLDGRRALPPLQRPMVHHGPVVGPSHATAADTTGQVVVTVIHHRRLRLVSLNAWGGAMYDELRSWLRHCDADVLCLQEITRTPGLRGATRFDDADRSLPQRANLFDDIDGALAEHLGSFAASDRGPVTTPDGRTHRQEFGLALFTHRDVTVIERATRFVHGEFADHQNWPTDGRPRIAQAARLRHHATGHDLTVVHLHGLRDPSGKADTPARLDQAQRLAAFVDDVRAPHDITVVCGDLNLLPDSTTFDVLAEIGLTDLVKTADTRTSRYGKPVRHADYMLVSDPSIVTGFEVRATPEVSDHRILQLEIASRNEGNGP